MSLSAVGGRMKRRSENPVIITQNHDIVIEGERTTDIATGVRKIQEFTEVPQSKSWRRLLWTWLRIYVRDGKEKVNIRIPIPLPLVGGLFPRQMDTNRSLMLYELMQNSDNPAKTMREFMESSMAVEFIRVEEPGELVIIGLD